MASYIEKGDSLFIPFRNGVSIYDSQLSLLDLSFVLSAELL